MIGGIYACVVYQDNVMPKVKPGGQFEEFSEVRARHLLDQLTDLGPRPSGSKNCEVILIAHVFQVSILKIYFLLTFHQRKIAAFKITLNASLVQL